MNEFVYIIRNMWVNLTLKMHLYRLTGSIAATGKIFFIAAIKNSADFSLRKLWAS